MWLSVLCVVYSSLHMDLLWLPFLLFYMVPWIPGTSANIADQYDTWQHISMRYGQWYRPPLTVAEAISKGYIRKDNSCKTRTHIGFVHHRHGDTISMPIYDSNGRLAGIQTAIPGNLKGFNSRNQSIPLPPPQVTPPFLRAGRNSRGVEMYILTAYFKHPRLICNPSDKLAKRGRGLYIQMGHDAEKEYTEIPLISDRLPPQWVKGGCIPKAGVHYFMNLSKHLPCESIYPVFLLYDMEGRLGGFGWSFQGVPPLPSQEDISWFRLQPAYYPFLFETLPLPRCMLHKDFRLSGVRVWLEDSDRMLCSVNKVPHSSSKPDTNSQSHRNRNHDYNTGITIIVNDRHEDSKHPHRHKDSQHPRKHQRNYEHNKDSNSWNSQQTRKTNPPPDSSCQRHIVNLPVILLMSILVLVYPCWRC